MNLETTREYAEHLDRSDLLSGFRDQFSPGEPGLIYLDGNSLGRPSLATLDRIETLVRKEWAEGLIRSWNAGWYEASCRIGARIAGLIGAGEDEVIVADSTSINLFKLAASVLEARPDCDNIITDDLNFPTDLYVFEAALNLSRRAPLKIVSSRDGISGPVEELMQAIDSSTALLSLSHVSFKSSFMYDMESITRFAHKQGAWVLWDLSHSVGAVPINLGDCGVEMAVGCTYKYLNGGPGAPAFLYVRRDLQDDLHNPIPGWFGHNDPFAFDLTCLETKGIRRFLTGTPPIISLSAIESAVEVIEAAGIEEIRRKSIAQTNYLIDLCRKKLFPLGFTLKSPESGARRGSHISLGHPEAFRICRSLIEEKKVLPDFRQPDNIRLGISPLYTSFAELYDAVEHMRAIVADEAYQKYSMERTGVT